MFADALQTRQNTHALSQFDLLRGQNRGGISKRHIPVGYRGNESMAVRPRTSGFNTVVVVLSGVEQFDAECQGDSRNTRRECESEGKRIKVNVHVCGNELCGRDDEAEYSFGKHGK